PGYRKTVQPWSTHFSSLTKPTPVSNILCTLRRSRVPGHARRTSMSLDIREIGALVAQHSQFVHDVIQAMERVIVGQRALLERLLVGLLANGHVLLEGVPGLAKTKAVTTLAQTLQADYQRIQFTPDLLPADVIGTLIYQPQLGSFQVRKGPVFAN